MCDLIDLNSPDAKGSRNPTKLASPLIPAPKNVESKVETNSLMITEKRENEGNNPFDMVLHETAEYVSRKGDPFEVMLQRALKSKRKRAIDLKAQPVNFADDFTPKSKRRYLKMRNKTLDGSLLEMKLYPDISSEDQKVKIKIETVDVENADVCDNNATKNTSTVKYCQKLFVTGPELESSILNQSAMNDTLLESVPKSIKDDDISVFLEKDTLFKEFGLSSNNLKSRSLSQGAGRSPTISCLNKRSLSVTDDQKKFSQSDYSSASCLLDKAFLQSKQDEQSIFSSLSNVSSITKLSSISISSSIDTMNHAFLDSNSLKLSQEKIDTTENSMEIKSKYDLSDLAERLDKLRCTMNEAICTSNIMETESNFMKEEKKQISNDKLIDVDVFLPEQNSSKECNKSSTSTVSLDSVFSDTNKVDKSILNEAKMLSKTFEELALRTDSESNTDDDLLSNNTLWMSELLPAFEDDLVVDNLIELPISPEENSKDIRNNNKEQSLTSDNVDNVDRNSLKEMEPHLTDCVKQTIITSLLSDLRKLVKVESNPEVNKLLDNLENILDSNCKNNTELLVTCLNISNELRSPQKISSKSSDMIERSEVTSTDKSEGESEKISSKEEISNAEKLPSDINRLEDTLQTTTSSSGSLSVKPSSYKDNSENYYSLEEEHTNCTKENDKDEKLAVELLMNLGKLLSGEVEDATTMQLLKSIGKALNVASNNHKSENEIQLDNNKRRSIQQATPIKASESDCNAHSTKAKHRRSIETKPKPFEKTVRRSISVIHSSPKNTSNMQIRKYRSTSEVEDGKRHFSSEPRLIGNLANKKAIVPETCNIGKADVIQSESKKEKCIAINGVKNKLKKRTDVVNKRGPMKAVHPVDNMQKKGAFSGKQTASSSQTTPPKSDKTTCGKIISSTPNSIDNKHVVKKSVKSKPIASSTPDGQNSKTSNTHLSANKKGNLSCDISPVTAYVNMSGSDERKESPKKLSKLPTPKKCTTPKTNAFRNSKFSTPPKHNLSFNVNYQRSPQRLNRSLIDRPRYSPVHQKKSAEKIQQSPFKENRITGKVKPLNLISKLKQHGTDDVIDKENNYA